MSRYSDPFDDLAEIVVYGALLAGWAISFGVAVVMLLTCGTEESLCDLLGWPSGICLAFTVGLYLYVVSSPLNPAKLLGFGPEPLDGDVEATKPGRSGEKS